MRLGIASWTVPWAIGMPGYPPPLHPLTALDLVRLAAKHNIHLLQIADNLPLHKLSPAELTALRAAAEQHNVALQTGTRGVHPDHLLAYLEISKQLGAKVIRTVSQTSGGKPHISEVKTWIERILPEFEKAGIAIALENNEAHRVSEFAWLVREINSPSLGICMDTANSLGALELLHQVVETLAPHAIVLHAKDFDIMRIDTRMGFNVVGRPAGEGRVDFDWLLAQLKRHGRDPDVILEHWPPFTGTIEKTIQMEEDWVQRSLRFLRARVT